MKEPSVAEKNKILKEYILDDFYRMRSHFDRYAYIAALRNCLQSLDYDFGWFVKDGKTIEIFFLEKYCSPKNQRLSFDDAVKILNESYPS